MKKPILILSIVFLMFMSCSMDIERPEVINPEPSIESQLQAYFQSDGSEEQDMDLLLYEIVEAYESEILNPRNFSNYIKLFQEYEEVHLSKILSSSLITELKIFEQGLKVQGEEFFSCLMIPNIDVADFSLNPIIAPGVEVDFRGDDLSGNVIVGWYYNEKGEKNLIHLDEKLGTTIERPVFIITNDNQTEAKVPKGTTYPSMIKSTGVTSYDFPEVDACMIEQRFESPGRSDVNLAFCAYTYTTGAIGDIYNEKLKDIHKDYLYSYVDCFVTLEPYYRHAQNLKTIYMVSYEKDWNRSYKDITFPDGKWINDMCKMKYSTEYYVRTYARYTETGDLWWYHSATNSILVQRDNGGLLFYSW